jgi:hypothetical protein
VRFPPDYILSENDLAGALSLKGPPDLNQRGKITLDPPQAGHVNGPDRFTPLRRGIGYADFVMARVIRNVPQAQKSRVVFQGCFFEIDPSHEENGPRPHGMDRHPLDGKLLNESLGRQGRPFLVQNNIETLAVDLQRHRLIFHDMLARCLKLIEYAATSTGLKISGPHSAAS